jgi:hypothetical protein
MPKEKAILQVAPPGLKVTNVATAFNTSYSLVKDKESRQKQVFNLEKQFALADQLLSRAEGKQVLQLEDKKKACLDQKESLQKAIQKIEQVQLLIKQFRLLFEFVEEFYTFAISLLSSIEGEKVIRQRLANLKKSEKNLMELAPAESYFFYETFNGLNLFAYKAFIENYRENFFLGLSSEGSQYSDYVLFVEKIKIFFGGNYLAVTQDSFNLKNIDAFLCQYISKLVLPGNEYCSIGLWASFFYTILLCFMKLQPITSNLDGIKLAMEFHTQVLAFNFKENYFYKFLSLKIKFNAIEKKVAEFFFQNKQVLTREEGQVVLNFIKKARSETLAFEKKIEALLNSRNFLRMLGLVGKILHEKKAMDVLAVLKVNTGLDFTLIEIEKLDFRYVKTHKDALQYFFYILYNEEERCRVAECLAILIEKIVPFDSSEDILQLEKLSTKDFITLSYCCFTSIVYAEFFFSLIKFKDKLQSRGLYALSLFFSLTFEQINERQLALTHTVKEFFEKKFSIASDFFSAKKNLLEEIELVLGLFQETITFEEGGIIESIVTDDIYDINSYEMPNFTEVLNRNEVSPSNLFASLQIQKEELELKKKEILSREFVRPVMTNVQIKKSFDSSSKSVCNASNESLELVEDFFEPLDSIYHNIGECLSCIQHCKNFYNSKETIRLRQKFFSALGQVRSLLTRLYDTFSGWVVPKLFTEVPTSFLGLLTNLKKLREYKGSAANDSFVKLEKKVDACIALLAEVAKAISFLSKACEQYNNKIKEPLTEINLLLSENSSNPFFLSAPKLKQFDKAFIRQVDGLSLMQQFSYLQALIKVVNYKASYELLSLYELMAQRDQYENVLHCVKQQIESLRKMKRWITTDKLKEVDKEEKAIAYLLATKQRTKNKSSFQKEVGNEVSAVPEAFSIKGSQPLVLQAFKQWDAEFAPWKTKSEALLFTIFQVVEQASMTVLNRSISTFLKLLQYYREDFTIKEREFKEQQLKLALCYLGVENPFENYLLRYEQWFASLLADITTYTNFLYEFDKKCQLLNGSDSINIRLQFFSANRPAEFDSLLAAYLASVVRCNKNKVKLSMEEDKLYHLNREFISKVQSIGSLNLLEREAALFSRFNEQIAKVNGLNGLISQEYVNREQIKAKLTEIIPLDLLQFYINRINPSDKVVLTDCQLVWPTIETINSPAAFYYTPIVAEAANLSNIGQLVYPTLSC